MALKRLWAGPDELEGSNSDQPADSPSEPASPPPSGARDCAGRARGVWVAAGSGLPEGVGLVCGDVG